ncbi:MAG: lamin tail domain-containing protein [Sedimentisphaerales bacterium]|nr:lamin tail domain-containing protein [Sedimentisphaerales bacterium]
MTLHHRRPGPRDAIVLLSLLALQLCIPCALFADSVVVINEIMYNPREANPEWVELYNQMGTHVDLSGWSLAGAVDYTFPEGTILPAGLYLVVASSVEGDPQTMPAVPLGPFDGKLSNGGEEIRLLNNSGRVMNRVRYSDRGDWPVAPDGSGVTLAKIDPTRESETASNWTWSDRDNGTPGGANFGNATPLPRPLRLNEIGPAGDASFFVEIVNVGTEAVAMADAWLEIQGSRDGTYTFDNDVLEPGRYLVVATSDLGFAPQAGDRLFLGWQSGRVSDAVRVSDTVTGRQPAGTGPWLVPSLPTPGQANEVELCTDVVINEIMYHPQTLPREETKETIAVFDEDTVTKVLVPQDDRLGRQWTGGSEPFDDGAWIEGAGTGVGYETGSGYEPYIDTDVRAAMHGRYHTVYIRIPFEVADPNALATLTLNVRYDDGFLAFLNGTLIASGNMSGSEAWNDPAAGSHDDSAAASYQGFDLSNHRSQLKAGVNILAIEGHNISLTSSDLLFQASLEGAPADPAADDDKDGECGTWLELYNKGTETVDLSGWTFDEGITYTFPEATFLPPGQYLVVARDQAYLAALFPDVLIVGDFEGRLANGGEELRLLDARGNPVDRVRYYDGGTWPETADGGGSSLELRDPWSDNDCGAAWAPSDELSRSRWQAVSYRDVVQASPVGNDGAYHEFVMGLLDAGEILIDDLHVIEDPDGAARERLQNGDFSPGLDHWRIVGSHRHSRIQADPNDPANPVLRLVATGATDHMHNHAETTFANGARINNGREVEIRFRARWITGSPLLHTRLFFNRLPRTTVLAVSSSPGTPGRPNSCLQPNIGPTLTGLRHTPAVPLPGQAVAVSVNAADPDGIEKLTLWYRQDNGPWQSADMSESEGRFAGIIPPHASHTLVQFYVEAQDAQGGVALCPAAGQASFAQYRVLQTDAGGGTAPRRTIQPTGPFAPRTTGVFNYRIVMRDAESDFLYEPTNRMSNEHLGATLIVNERDVYYNVGVRLKGSEHGRPKDARIGFHLRFHPEKLFRGVHRTVSFDRSDGQQVGQREMLFHMAMNRFGGFSKYHDLGYLIAPRQEHCSGIEVQLARYGPVYCEEAYGDEGGDGTLYEYELIYTLAATVGNDPEGLKIPQEGGGVYGISVTNYLGTDKEKYRWHFLIKNHRDMDDYGPVIDLTRALGLGQTAFTSTISETIDVDQWLRSFAVGSTTGVGDNWISDSGHNAMFYFRPTDEKFLFFLHDVDFAFQQSRALESNSVLRKLLGNPTWAHTFYGYVYDFLQVSFNRPYMSIWTEHYAQLLPEQAWSSWLSYIDGRCQNVMGQVMAKAGAVIPFAITAPPARIVTSPSTTIRGRGWIDVRYICIAETGQALAVEWPDLTTWEARLPADLAPGSYTLGAYNSQGTLLATDTIAFLSGQ